MHSVVLTGPITQDHECKKCVFHRVWQSNLVTMKTRLNIERKHFYSFIAV